jgi:very-short-patch-repair endonuclease
MTRSELERLFLRFCRRHRLPQPQVNVRVGRFEVDFLWPEQRVIVEADGYRYHGNRAAFESDRAKDAELQHLGYRVLRFTHRQIGHDPDAIARAIRALLSAAQPPPTEAGLGR